MVIAALALAAAAAAPPVTPSAITEVTDISGVAVSPDGRWVAFRTDQASVRNNGYRLAWHVAPVNGDAPARIVADGGGATLFDSGMLRTDLPVWSPDSSAFYMRALRDGAIQVWKVDIATNRATMATHEAGDVEEMAASPDGRSLELKVGPPRTDLAAAEESAIDDGVLVDESIDIAQPLSRGGFVDGKPASQRLTGHWFARGNLLWRQGQRSVTLAVDGGAQGPAVNQKVAPRFRIETKGALTTLTAQDASGRWARCTATLCSTRRIRSVVPLKNGNLLITTVDDARGQTLSVWRPGQPNVRILARSEGLLSGDRYGETPCGASTRVIVCVAADANAPPALIAIDQRSGRWRVLFDPNPELRKQASGRWQALRWQTSDGHRFAGQLLVPGGHRPPSGYPLVINYYDCAGYIRGGLGDELPYLPLAAGGVAGLCINKPLTGAASRQAASDFDVGVAGVSAILDELERRHLVDRAHIGMSGLSFGSEIAMAVVRRTSLLSAVSISTGLVEPAFYWINGVRGRDTPAALARNWQVGAPDADTAGWKALSPALDIGHIRTPILLQLPEQEARWTMEFYAKLSRTTTPVEMWAFADAPHNKFMPRQKLAVYARNLDWFRYWLQGFRDPAPAKQAQYERWYAMHLGSVAVGMADPHLGVGEEKQPADMRRDRPGGSAP